MGGGGGGGKGDVVFIDSDTEQTRFNLYKSINKANTGLVIRVKWSGEFPEPRPANHVTTIVGATSRHRTTDERRAAGRRCQLH